MNNNEQLELGFNQKVLRITVRRRQASRAKWWFGQMRRAVDSAIDLRGNGSSSPEHVHLIPARRPSLA